MLHPVKNGSYADLPLAFKALPGVNQGEAQAVWGFHEDGSGLLLPTGVTNPLPVNLVSPGVVTSDIVGTVLVEETKHINNPIQSPFISASRSASPTAWEQNSAEQRGLHIFLDVTAGTGTLQIFVDLRSPMDFAKWFTILSTPIVTGGGAGFRTYLYGISPDLNPASAAPYDAVAKAQVADQYRIRPVSNGTALTWSLGIVELV